MPVTRRKRANPPEEPENNNNNHASQTEQHEQQVEATTPEAIPEPETVSASAPTPEQPQEPEAPVSPAPPEAPASPVPAEVPPMPVAEVEQQPEETPNQEERAAFVPIAPVPPVTPAPPSSNGDHVERREHIVQPPTEGVRRPIREGFRRPLQPQVQQPPQPPPPPPVPAQAALQPPTHEISLPLGNVLHLAYNPGYTGAEEARSTLLTHLARETKAGGRARCWNCGSIAIAYERWNTRSKTFGEIGIAFCEICGVWSVM